MSRLGGPHPRAAAGVRHTGSSTGAAPDGRPVPPRSGKEAGVRALGSSGPSHTSPCWPACAPAWSEKGPPRKHLGLTHLTRPPSQAVGVLRTAFGGNRTSVLSSFVFWRDPPTHAVCAPESDPEPQNEVRGDGTQFLIFILTLNLEMCPQYFIKKRKTVFIFISIPPSHKIGCLITEDIFKPKVSSFSTFGRD